MKHADFDPLNITQLSGHRNLKPLDDYSAGSDEQQGAMSFVLTQRVPGKKQNPSVANHVQAASATLTKLLVLNEIFNTVASITAPPYHQCFFFPPKSVSSATRAYYHMYKSSSGSKFACQHVPKSCF